MATTLSNAGRSFSADVLSRILTVLRRDGATKKTNLAGKTRLNYITCLKYLELLKSLGLVHTTFDHDTGGERISISEFGLRFNTNLIAYLQKACANETEYHYFNGEKNVTEYLQSDLTDTIMITHEDIDEDGENAPGKIMLVDDEKDILFTYKLFLSEGGLEADIFSDPAEALRQIALSPTAYQLVITDIRMSSINGLQLYHGIRALNRSIRIIFLSALDAADELVSVLPGVNKEFVLKKPVNKEMFTKAVVLAMQQTNGKRLLPTLQ